MKRLGYLFQILILFCLFIAPESCDGARSSSRSVYNKFYQHLKAKYSKPSTITETDYYIVFLCTGRHLDYTENRRLLKSLVKHANGSKGGDVGHSWVYLKGIRNGKPYIIEGGQTGETGAVRPKYYEGVVNNSKYGYPDPTMEQRAYPRKEPNPIKYLWADVNDGFFQVGSGGFTPTIAAKVDLTKEQFDRIVEFIHPDNYNYQEYSLVGNQCSSYLAKIAAVIGYELETEVTVKLESKIKIRGKMLTLWEDPHYSTITFATPDIIERSLIEAMQQGRAEYALKWYRSSKRDRRLSDWAAELEKEQPRRRSGGIARALLQFPRRLVTYWML